MDSTLLFLISLGGVLAATAILIGIVVFFVIALPRIRKRNRERRLAKPQKATKQVHVEAPELARNIGARLQSIAVELADQPTGARVADLSLLCERLALNVEDDPRDKKLVTRFLQYYGDVALKLATMYRNLIRRGLSSHTIQRTLDKLEHGLGSLQKAFTLHLERLQSDNLLDIEVELEVLRRTLALDGLAELLPDVLTGERA